MPDPTPAEEIRARYVEVIAMQRMGADPARWRAASEALRTATRGLAEPIVRALEAAGLLPSLVDYRWVYEPDGTPLGYREQQLLTDWREAHAPCTGCEASERQCGAGEGKCCPECRHPTRRPAEAVTPDA